MARKCGKCGNSGHNSRTCANSETEPSTFADNMLTYGSDVPLIHANDRSQYENGRLCSICDRRGHTKVRCGLKFLVIRTWAKFVVERRNTSLLKQLKDKRIHIGNIYKRTTSKNNGEKNHSFYVVTGFNWQACGESSIETMIRKAKYHYSMYYTHITQHEFEKKIYNEFAEYYSDFGSVFVNVRYIGGNEPNNQHLSKHLSEDTYWFKTYEESTNIKAYYMFPAAPYDAREDADIKRELMSWLGNGFFSTPSASELPLNVL